MPHLIAAPAVIEAAGTLPTRIEEFAEITVVLRGCLRVEHEGGAPGKPA